MTALDLIQAAADKIEMVANIILVAVAWKWWRGQQWVQVRLSVGSFKVRRKSMDLPTLTAIVSRTFYKGEWVPPAVRHELLNLTAPDAKDLQIFGAPTCGDTPPEIV